MPPQLRVDSRAHAMAGPEDLLLRHAVEPEYRWHLEVLDTLLDDASLSHDRVGVFGVHPP